MCEMCDLAMASVTKPTTGRDDGEGNSANPPRASWFRGILDLIAGRDRSTMPVASARHSFER